MDTVPSRERPISLAGVGLLFLFTRMVADSSGNLFLILGCREKKAQRIFPLFAEFMTPFYR